MIDLLLRIPGLGVIVMLFALLITGAGLVVNLTKPKNSVFRVIFVNKI